MKNHLGCIWIWKLNGSTQNAEPLVFLMNSQAWHPILLYRRNANVPKPKIRVITRLLALWNCWYTWWSAAYSDRDFSGKKRNTIQKNIILENQDVIMICMSLHRCYKSQIFFGCTAVRSVDMPNRELFCFMQLQEWKPKDFISISIQKKWDRIHKQKTTNASLSS